MSACARAKDGGSPEADICRNVLALLERQEAYAAHSPKGCAPFGPGIRLVMLAAAIARTPDVALPRVPELDSASDLRRSSAADHLVLDASAPPA